MNWTVRKDNKIGKLLANGIYGVTWVCGSHSCLIKARLERNVQVPGE